MFDVAEMCGDGDADADVYDDDGNAHVGADVGNVERVPAVPASTKGEQAEPVKITLLKRPFIFSKNRNFKI